jgi:acyl-CoA thioester hydrolase
MVPIPPDVVGSPFDRPFFVPIPVRFSEIDMYRIAWHGHYPAWLEEARNRLALAAGFSLERFLDEGLLFPLVDLSIRYRRPARLGDQLRVYPRYVPDRAARISFSYEIRLEDGPLLASATTRQVVLRGEELLVTLPPPVRAIFDRLAEIQKRWDETSA